MPKLQSFKRIIAEDFPEKERPLIQKLAYSINIFAEDVLGALTKQISIDDNLNIVKKTIRVTVDVTGTPISDLNIKTGLDHTCQGILVIKVNDLVTINRPPSGTPFVSFTELNGLVTVTNITNLVGNNQYDITVILF